VIIGGSIHPDEFSKDPITQRHLRNMIEGERQREEDDFGPDSRTLIRLTSWLNYDRDLAIVYALEKSAGTRIYFFGKCRFIVRRNMLPVLRRCEVKFEELYYNGEVVCPGRKCPPPHFESGSGFLGIDPWCREYVEPWEVFVDHVIGSNAYLELMEQAIEGSGVEKEQVLNSLWSRVKRFFRNYFSRE